VVRRRRHSATINLFYLPAGVLFAVFIVYPLISGVAISFTDWDGYRPERQWVGLDNFVRLVTDANFHSVLITTVIYGVVCTALQQVIGLGLALALDRKVRGRAAARAIIYLPLLVSPVVMGTFYYLLFQYNNGALNDVARALGGSPQAWLSTTGGGVTAIVIVNTFQYVGISMIIFLAGLQSIPSDYSEAATLDGATGWQRFRFVTFPLLQPALATSVILNLIGGLKLYDIIQVLTGGGPGTTTSSVSTLIARTYFANQAAGYSAAMGLALLLIIVVLTVAASTQLNRRRLDQL